MHNRGSYAKHIRKWLNCEWKRLGKGRVGGKIDPFDKAMLLRSPKSKLFFELSISTHNLCPSSGVSPLL